jgi:hypothetical protein
LTPIVCAVRGGPATIRGLHEGAEAFLGRAERVLGTPAPRTELAEQQAESDEDGEAQRIRAARMNPPAR